MKVYRGLIACILALLLLLTAGLSLAEGSPLRGYNKEEGYVYVTLGQYKQTLEGGVEPIIWRVLTVDEEKAYLLSEYVLFARPMHTSEKKMTFEQGKNGHGGDYSRNEYRDVLKGDFAQTELCQYLNTTFAEEAFSEEEMELLLPCEDFGKVFLVTRDDMKNKSIGLGVTYEGKTNTKKIFEKPGIRAWGTEWAIHDNGYPESEYPDPEARIVGRADEHITVHEARLYVFQKKYGSCSPWWGRSSSETNPKAAVATKDGGQVGFIEVARDNIGVRPALYLAEGSYEIAGGEGTLESPWQIVPKE